MPSQSRHTSDGPPPLRTIEQEELDQTLSDHRDYVSSSSSKGKKCRLARTNLRKPLAFPRLVELSSADLSGADFVDQTMIAPRFNDADLIEADFRDVKLKPASKQVSEVALPLDTSRTGASFVKATLISTDFEGAEIREGNFREANLQGAVLRNATLQDSNFTGAINLVAGQFAAANVAGARLPPEIARFDGLSQVEERSRNARKLFLAMLLGCAYALLTVATTTDVRLLTNSASSPLPIIGAEVPIVGFYLGAPLILLGLFVYFQIHLQRNWEVLATLPAVFPDGWGLDRKAFPWILNGLVRRHFRLLRDPSLPFYGLQTASVVALAWCAVPLTLSFLWLSFLVRHDWTITSIHVVFLALCIWFAVLSYRIAVKTLRGRRPQLYRPYLRLVVLVLILVLLFCCSWSGIEGSPESSTFSGALGIVGLKTYADISEEDLSTKPPNWTGDSAQLPLVRGAKLQGGNLRHAVATRAFLVNADLRRADLSYADLTGADLRGADLDGAVLKHAHLFRADLSGAQLRGTDLTGADLIYAQFRGAVVSARLDSTLLEHTNFSGADLTGAQGLSPDAKGWYVSDSATRFPEDASVELRRESASP